MEQQQRLIGDDEELRLEPSFGVSSASADHSPAERGDETAPREHLPKYFHGGYAYVKDRTSADGKKVFWRCAKKSAPNACNGRIWTNAEDHAFLSIRTPHNCGRCIEGSASGNETPPSATAIVKIEAGDNLTNAILGILPQPQQYTDTGPTNNDSKGHLRQEQPQQQQPADQQLPSSSGSSIHHLHGGPTTFPDHLHNHQRSQPSTGGQGLRNVPTTGTSGGGRNIVVQQQHNTGRMFDQSLQSAHQQHLMPASEHPNHNGNKLLLGNPRKRRALQAQHLLLNGFAGDCSADGAESVELRLKRLKCELIEKQLLDLERQEEWRLKQEFMLGRQTAAMENIVIQLRQIKEKLK